MVRDIREGPVEEYWDRLREMMGPDGLITYWYLGRAFNQAVDPDTVLLRRDMRNSAGGIMAAPLAIAAPETGGWRDREAIPAPVAYGLHILDDARDVAEIRVARSTVRRGAKVGFSRSLITDAADSARVIAITTGIGVTLGDAPASFRPVDVPPQLPDTVDLPPLHVVFGAKSTADGWQLPALTSRHASTSASLHLGPIHVVLEAAAMELAAELAGADAVQVRDWDVHFVSPGRTGPFLVRTDGWAGLGGRVVVRFTLVDEGRDNAVIAAGAATFASGPQ
ncbi:MAG: hypothetical protein QOD90_2924 [Mycobacterium sp.]|nr:hypothetical protein [Mycobacterium sp.]